MTPKTATVVHLMAPGQLELREEALPPLGAADVLCETLVTAISPGTELAAYQGLPPLRAGVVYPRLQGYCNVARVLETGAQVQGVAPGDRVLSFSSHRSHFVMGAHEVLLKLSSHAKAEDIVCTYLFHLGYNAILRSNVCAGSRVLVIGQGVLGLASVAMAATAGAVVAGLSDQPRPRELAARLGAAAAFGRDQLAALREHLGPGLADVVIVTTNSWDDWRIALQTAGMRATLAVLGFPGRGQAPGDFNPLDSQHFYAKQLRIESVGLSPEKADARGFSRFNERDNLAYLAGQIQCGRLQPSWLVSGTYRGTDIAQAYTDLIERRNAPITYLLSWNSN